MSVFWVKTRGFRSEIPMSKTSLFKYFTLVMMASCMITVTLTTILSAFSDYKIMVTTNDNGEFLIEVFLYCVTIAGMIFFSIQWLRSLRVRR